MKRIGVVIVFGALMFAVISGASPERARAAADPDVIPGRYIVTLNSSVSDVAGTAASLARGGTVHYVYTNALRGFAASLSDQAAEALRRNPNVAAVEPDGIVSLVDTQAPTPSWGLDRIDQRLRPLDNTYTSAATGAGVTAYIIDTGIRTTHADFGGRAVSGYDAVDGGTADDCNGHGTHVAGTVGGASYGVAKGATLVAVRVLNCAGSGTWSGVIAGIDWVTGNAAKPAVANMSLGGGASAAVDTAVSNSIGSGVTYAIAAGNDGRNACNYSPARVPSALTVGATSSTDAEASWSNYGTCVDLLAPGVSITSAWKNSDTATKTISGTSMATPHVAGAAALYLQGNTSASVTTVSAAITGSATSGVITLTSASASALTPNRLLFVGSTAPTPPGAPVLSGTAGDAAVTLTWTTPPDGGSAITGYRVYRGTVSGSATLLATLGVTTSYQDSTAANGTTYYYQVTATNAVGEGTRSNEVSATPQAPTAPAAPVLSGTAGNAVVNLSWTIPASGGSAITGYRVYRGESSGGGTLLATLGVATSYQDSTVANGTTYYYRVTAVNAVGEGAASNEVEATPQAPPAATTPGAPQNLVGSTANGRGTQLDWQAPASDGGSAVTGYRIYRSTTAGGAKSFLGTSSNLSYKDTATVRGQTYYYEVSAVNASGEGLRSNEASAIAK